MLWSCDLFTLLVRVKYPFLSGIACEWQHMIFSYGGPRSNCQVSLDLFQTNGMGDIGLNRTHLSLNSVCPIPLSIKTSCKFLNSCNYCQIILYF